MLKTVLGTVCSGETGCAQVLYSSPSDRNSAAITLRTVQPLAFPLASSVPDATEARGENLSAFKTPVFKAKKRLFHLTTSLYLAQLNWILCKIQFHCATIWGRHRNAAAFASTVSAGCSAAPVWRAQDFHREHTAGEYGCWLLFGNRTTCVDTMNYVVSKKKKERRARMESAYEGAKKPAFCLLLLQEFPLLRA